MVLLTIGTQEELALDCSTGCCRGSAWASEAQRLVLRVRSPRRIFLRESTFQSYNGAPVARRPPPQLAGGVERPCRPRAAVPAGDKAHVRAATSPDRLPTYEALDGV